MSQTWVQCLDSLKNTLPLGEFSVWVKPLKAAERNETLYLYAPSASALKYLNNHKSLEAAIILAVSEFDRKLKVRFGVVDSSKKTASQTKHHTTPLFPEYTFYNLVLGSANQVAALASRQIAEKIGASPYNPFIIYGESGLGKTHLMQAAGHLALEKNPNAKIIYVPLMDFVRNITTSLRHNTIENVKLFYQSADLLLVDDIHLIAGKDKSQEEFFHIFNFLFGTKKQIIFTCDQPPKNIKDLENRLKTRFSQGLNLQLSPPELEMRAAILLKKSQNPQISLNLSEDIALFIASHVVSNVRDLEGALLKLKAFVDFSQIDHSFITKDVVEGALGDLIKPKKLIIEVNEVQKTVSKFYGITVSDLISNSRKQHLVKARQMAIYLCHELTSLSLAKIGQNFGNRDHSTVLYSCEKLKGLINTNEEIKNDIENITIKITNL
ncbi:MAG: chromosomal replication initiator protein DnaA [Candidatus Thioglobus sp.]|jgi:chromosomal replication initiator protein|nr:chromosomal replication initiator protein DnaA [Candidatus Pseudothioglobus aerophilus]MBT3440019.1 chromosomal replication initiator protein DnaA [Gammaproteobacteria bacterium]MDP0560457.1 chromosomal replication initiator protein DnaA [Candidatus Thioglobus sp.]MBT4245239.1 chromosomal replication initiator protein DnaA [Gammaproteobacteria bacterium]MBT4586919.1 chromosomal replication initiator protein DnaA [Gammaproteobacteria bacterium]